MDYIFYYRACREHSDIYVYLFNFCAHRGTNTAQTSKSRKSLINISLYTEER